jgi:ABC-2 type transport system permease protein
LLPPSPLEWLAFGQSDLYPAAYAGPEFEEVSQIDNPLQLSIGHWDLSMVAVFILPIVILTLGFDLTATDRDSGILALALSQAVRASTILLGKWAALSFIILATVSLMLILGILPTGIHLDAGFESRIWAAALAILAYTCSGWAWCWL